MPRLSLLKTRISVRKPRVRQRTAVILGMVLLFCLVSALPGNTVLAADGNTADDPVRSECLRKLPKQADSACRKTKNIEHMRNAATYNCQDQPGEGNKKADCVEKYAKGYITKALKANPKPKDAKAFEKALGKVLEDDIKKTGGSITKPSKDSGALSCTDGSGGDCAVAALDPSYCSAWVSDPKNKNKPLPQGCSSDANAVCDQNNCDFVQKYVNPAINILSVIFGLVAALSIIIGGVQYTTSAGDSGKVQAAKKRISLTIIAFVCYAFLYSFLQFLVPGGIF